MAATSNPLADSTAISGFEMAAGRPASRQIYEWLRREIIQGHIQPGTTLSEANLCNHFGVSRQPVREALLLLSTQSLARIYPQRGSVVTRISVPTVVRAQLIREAVEVEALRRAIERRSERFLKDLRTELDLQRVFSEAGDIERFFESDQSFHRRISEQCGVRGIWESLEDSRSQLDRARHAELMSQQKLAILIEQHESVFEGIAAGDVEAATAAMRDHLRRITEHLPSTIADLPDWFEDSDSVDPEG